MTSLFSPVYSGRSDGVTEIRTTKHGKEANGPSADQLDKVANPSDYYELLDHDHSVAVEWKRVLGGMLQREMRVQSEAPWFLMFFPENYRLYKHNKQTRDHTGKLPSSSTTAQNILIRLEMPTFMAIRRGGRSDTGTPWNFSRTFCG